VFEVLIHTHRLLFQHLHVSTDFALWPSPDRVGETELLASLTGVIRDRLHPSNIIHSAADPMRLLLQ
jgi:hypothetical protein